MLRRLDYARARISPSITPIRDDRPRLAALAFVALFIVGWSIFFAVGSTGAVETHFTSRPQDYPQFQLTPWRPMKTTDPKRHVLTRDAIMPLTMHTLRYTQVTDDGGATIETTVFHADVRWGPTALALVASGLLPLVVYFGLRKALRISKRAPLP